MIRKQLYLEPHQDRKLKRLAAMRKCTEAEVIRAAIDEIAEPAGDLRDRLRRMGLLADTSVEDVPSRQEAEALRTELDIWMRGQQRSLGLSDAVLEDRGAY